MHVAKPPPPPADPPPDGGRPAADAPLFRPEALEAQQSRWMGTVLVAPGVPGAALAALALAAAAAVVALFAFGEYTRKARVTGWLAPERGVVRVFAPRPGVATRLHVREGEAVAAGAPLLTLSGEVRSGALGATGERVVARLRERLESLAATRAAEGRLAAQEADELGRRVAMMDEELRLLGREAELQRERVEIAERGAERQRGLRAQALATALRVERTEEDRLDQALRLQALERTRASLARERAEAAAALAALPLRRQQRLAELDRAAATLEQELAGAEAEREILVTAPEAGVVTALLAEAGGGVSTATPLLGIVPEDARLEAQLFAPSRAVGFVRPGQRVLLRYAAFPYQKFGQHEGRIAQVSRAAVAPSELPQRLSGLAALAAGGEPLYRIAVALEEQSVAAYGTRLPLQPGMQLEADVLVDTRRLYEWVLDPLFTLTGRWRS
jgi:membrane fusion protein